MDQTNRITAGGGRSHNLFEKIISLDNLFTAWREFRRNKLKKQDVLAVTDNLEDNIFSLHQDLLSGTYCHGPYHSFFLCDPKKRHIHKASVRDRLLHHAIHRVLEPIFEPTFIYDSYASRDNKGLHKALKRFNQMAWKLSRNDTKTVWVLKCDVQKFFDSVDHSILFSLLRKKILDNHARNLIIDVIKSFEKSSGKGLPLGNLTSQLFANIYLNHFDQFIKRELGVKNHVRYVDDFVILSNNKKYLEDVLLAVSSFLKSELSLELHQRKVIFRKWHQGVDFLGYVLFPHHQILRTKTKKRIFRKITNESRQSYFGLLKHCRGRKIREELGG
ncbi:MAG: reverse transcriptase domain-containing protein [Candidatus Vogelbacteria bacterium]